MGVPGLGGSVKYQVCPICWARYQVGATAHVCDEPLAPHGPGVSPSIMDLQGIIAAWADEIFPNRTAHNALVKLMVEEIPEFCMNPVDPGEYADLVILILDIGHLNHIDVGQAVLDKMRENRERQWQLNEFGVMKHVK